MSNQGLVMYMVIRKDLITKLNWPIGSVITQACHAATSTIWTKRTHPNTITYLNDIQNMHKVTLEVKNEDQLIKICQGLDSMNLEYTSWIEQPENILTCIATVPYPKSEFGDVFKKAQLFR